MEEAMKAKSIFMVVGAVHLGGDYDVISLLCKAGYSVEPNH
ncbi:TraB family protein [Algoriphagus alkaliphilus]|uniref:TraB family protein n=1 Tax=Algoriphagus alkaliphilus TaxID=279824 RepID=A0A1G5XWG0_9BACT|nr:TraB family protein [Algoriphagus alkaliphilus]